MRKMYTTKCLLGTVACATLLFVAAPTSAQNELEVVEEQPLFDGDAQAKDDNQVAQTETGEIELHVKDLEITKVLQLLSIQTQRNIIASRGVENAKVSADLYGVSFDDALKSILDPNGFDYVEEGNFIYVLTKEEAIARKNADRKPVTRIHRLNYLRADEAAGFVTPMLSENGAITASGNVEDGIQPTLDNAGADNYSGPPTLVIRDYEDSVDAIVAVLQQLDVEPKQVIIEATVLRATLTENNQFGVDFSLFSDLTGASPLDIIDDAITGGAPTAERFGALQSNVGDVASQAGGVKLGFIAGDAAIFVSALDSVTDTTLIATPKVTVLDRNRTSILVGDKIAYLSTTVTETSETQTVEFLEVGTQLNVRPFVSSDGKIRLELRPSVSDATIRTIGSTSVPDESTVELTTNVIVESGQTIVLGGLFTDDSSVSRSQVPGLGSVPFLGKAFQGQDDTVGRSEVIFLVKATVDENHKLVNGLGKEGMDRVAVARLAERESLLPWSRSNLTSAHFVNARKNYDEALSLTGEARDKKMAEALYCVDMALHMNPSMVDALILKEKITGKSAYIKYEESIVTDTYDAVMNAQMKELGLPELPALPTQGAEAGDELVAPELLGQARPGFDAFGEPAPAEAAEAKAPTQAEEDAAWLEKMLADQFSEADAEAPAVEEVAEVTDADESVEEVAEVVELDPANDAELTDEQASEDASWRELSTAELLQQAAEATEQAAAEEAQADAEEVESEEDIDEAQADADTETDNETADVPTETD